MKNFSTLVCLFAALFSGLTSCQKEPAAPSAPVSATYRVLNEQGQETAVFAPGQAIVLRYEVQNNTDQEVFLSNPVFDYAHFMEVFSEANGQSRSLGTPYTDMSMVYITHFTVAAHSTRSFTIPWVASAQYPEVYPFNGHAATTALPVGRYHTSVLPRLAWHQGTAADVTVPLAAQDFVRTFEVR